MTCRQGTDFSLDKENVSLTEVSRNPQKCSSLEDSHPSNLLRQTKTWEYMQGPEDRNENRWSQRQGRLGNNTENNLQGKACRETKTSVNALEKKV